MKTIFVNEKAQKRDWYIIDAAGKPLGRVAAKAAAIARGKNKATYTPNQEMGDYVVIINADKVAVTGGKETKKIYYKYTTGFVGSLRAQTSRRTNYSCSKRYASWRTSWTCSSFKRKSLRWYRTPTYSSEPKGY